MPTHELSVNLSRVPSSLRTTIVIRSVAVIRRYLTRSPTARPPPRQPRPDPLDDQRGARTPAARGLRDEHLDLGERDRRQLAQLAAGDAGRRGDVGQDGEQEARPAHL